MAKLAPDLEAIYQFEIARGNVVDHVEQAANGPYLVVFKQPLHTQAITQRLPMPATVRHWQSSDPQQPPQAGFFCERTRHALAGPVLGDAAARQAIATTVAAAAPGPANALAVPEPANILAPSFLLYSTYQVVLAAFVGGPLAGFILMTLNYRTLGRTGAAWAAAAAGLAATALITVLAFTLSDNLNFLTLGLPALVATGLIAHQCQGAAFAAHLQQGGRRASSWAAFGIGILSAAVLTAGFLGYDMLVDTTEPKVVVSPLEEVYYAEGASAADAQNLARTLQTEDYFDGKTNASVRVARPSGKYVVDFVVRAGAWNDKEVIDYYNTLGQALRKACPDGPVEVRLCDDNWTPRKVLKQ